MKNMTILRAIYLLLFTFAIISCSDDDNDNNNEETAFMNKLGKTWTIVSVTLDATDVTALFKDMTVSWGKDKRYTVTNAVSPIWNASGTFVLVKDGTSYTVKRDDEVMLRFTELSDTKAVFTFQYAAPTSGGRTTSVSGNYTFEMK